MQLIVAIYATVSKNTVTGIVKLGLVVNGRRMPRVYVASLTHEWQFLLEQIDVISSVRFMAGDTAVFNGSMLP